MEQSIRRHLPLPATAVLLLLSMGCGAFERARQMRTYTNMQGIAARIEQLCSAKGGLTDTGAAELIKSVAAGRDP